MFMHLNDQKSVCLQTNKRKQVEPLFTWRHQLSRIHFLFVLAFLHFVLNGVGFMTVSLRMIWVKENLTESVQISL